MGYDLSLTAGPIKPIKNILDENNNFLGGQYNSQYPNSLIGCEFSLNNNNNNNNNINNINININNNINNNNNNNNINIA